jgi:beta-lactamase regulating signal transducer with metallopeptidase domain
MNDFLHMLWTQAWQIAVLAIMVACCTRTIAKNRPHLAHAMWLLVLVKCVTPPMWGHPLGVFSRLQTLTVSDEKTDVSTSENVNSVETDLGLSLSIGDSSGSELPIESELAALQSTQPIVRINAANNANLITTPAPEVSDWRTAEPHRPSRDLWPGPLFFCLVVGAIATLSVMIIRCLRCLQSIHQHRTTEFDHLLNERLQVLSKKLRLRRVPRIIVSDVLFGPAVLGVLRHTIVLPRCLLQAGRSFLPERTFADGEPAQRSIDHTSLPEGAECTQVAASRVVLSGRQDPPKPLPGRQDLLYLDPILAHELLHIRRGDLRTGLLQAIVQSLWWFHPAVWFCNRWLSREAERCCDEQVIAELGCSPSQYARSLLSVIESKHQLQPIPVFPGMKPVEITSQRMERIMSLKTGLKKQTPLWCWLAVAVLAIAVLPGAIAKPQSDEKVVEPQPEEMGLPQETKIADVPEVDVSTKTYIVGDLIERLAKEQNLSLDQATKSLLQIFESSVVPVHRHVQGAPAPPVTRQQPSPPTDPTAKVIPIAGAVSSSSTEITELSSYTIDGDRMVVVQSAMGHATLQQYIDAVRQRGFTTFQLTARYIIGTPEEINSLMESLQLEKPFPKAAEGKTVPESTPSDKQSKQATTGFCVGSTGIVSLEEARKIEELARSKPDCLSIQCPTVNAINGQLATIRVGEIKPFIVGFKENDEPMIRTVVEGLTLRVTPKVLDKGLFQVKSVACLEGTSEQRLIATTGRVTETPKMFTLPAITEKRVQTTVELQENQAFLQSGMITTEEGKSQAFLAVLEARLIVPEVAGEAAEVDSLIGEPSGVGRAENRHGDKTNTPQEFEQSADPTVRLAWETREQVRLWLLSTKDHTPWQIMSGIEGLRRDMLLKDGKNTVNALEWIQEGPSFRGESWFEKTKHGGRAHPFSKPYWFEGHINQFFSKLAACRLPLDTQFGTPDGPITIQDMIDHAKMVVNDREAVSWTILALCRYLPPDTKWTNAKGEEWSIERLVDIEVGKQVGGPTSPNGGTDLLYALAVARNEYLKTGKPLEAVWLKADEKIRTYIDVAKSQQNPDGTLSSDFFRSSKRKDDFDKRLASSGHLLQFLMHAVSDEQLKEDWIRRAVEATANDIQVNGKEYVSCDPLFTATEALTTYLERVAQTSIGVVIGAGDTVQDMSTASTKTISSKVQATPETIDGSDKQPLVLLSYPVGELILPILSAKPDFAPLVELIKSTIEPDSWSEDAGQIVISHPDTLVIRQTPQVHDRIAKLLSQLLDDIDQVCVRFQLMKISSDIQLKGIQTRCTLHPMQDSREWALLTKERSEEIVKFLTSEKAQVFKWGAVTMFSGTTGQIRLGSSDGASNGLTILLGPRVIADIPVIRLLHSINGSSDSEHDVVTRAMQDFPINANESLIGSGQTLMLLVDANAESPVDQNEVSKPDPQSTKERFLVLLTVQRIEAQPVQ